MAIRQWLWEPKKAGQKLVSEEEDTGLTAADNLNTTAAADTLAVEAGCNLVVEERSV